MIDQLERCRPWLTAALTKGRDFNWSWDAIVEEARLNTVQLWPGEQSAMLTRLLALPEGGRVHVWLAGGNLGELLVMRVGVEAWGRAQGCTHATIDGRRGWEGALRKHGFRVVDGELRKELVA